MCIYTLEICKTLYTQEDHINFLSVSSSPTSVTDQKIPNCMQEQWVHLSWVPSSDRRLLTVWSVLEEHDPPDVSPELHIFSVLLRRKSPRNPFEHGAWRGRRRHQPLKASRTSWNGGEDPNFSSQSRYRRGKILKRACLICRACFLRENERDQRERCKRRDCKWEIWKG